MSRFVIDNTKFKFRTNWAKDPSRSKWPNPPRQGCIVIPDPAMVQAMQEEGIDVRFTRPYEGQEEGFVPEAYVKCTINYKEEYPPEKRNPALLPHIYLVPGQGAAPVLLDENTVGQLDTISVTNVDVVLNSWQNQRGGITLYIDTMYVTQNIIDDPFAAKYLVPSLA